MEIKNIIYFSITFIAVLFLVYIFIMIMKKKLVHRGIDKFSIYTKKPITHQELDNFMEYIEKNKKYLTASAYKTGIYKVNKIRTLI